MKTFAAALVLIPALSWAGSRPYVLRNGRASAAPHAGGGAAARAAAAAGSGVEASAGDGVSGSPVGGRAFAGARRGSSGHRSYWPASRGSSRAYRTPQRGFFTVPSLPDPDVIAPPDGSEPQVPEAQPVPPNFTKAGALVRTEGHRPYRWEEPAEAPRAHTLAASWPKAEPGLGVALTGAGLRQGPRDTPPPCNPGTCSGGGSAGGSGITPNVINVDNSRQNGASGNNNGNASAMGEPF